MIILSTFLAWNSAKSFYSAVKASRDMANAMSMKPPEFDSVKVPVAEDGREIPVIFGTVDLFGPNVTWHSKIDFKPIKSSGGKK